LRLERVTAVSGEAGVITVIITRMNKFTFYPVRNIRDTIRCSLSLYRHSCATSNRNFQLCTNFVTWEYPMKTL
jgi:hypothetical protein